VELHVTAKDIQNARQSEFDHELSQAKDQFLKAMALPIPEKPSFSEEMDKPIGEMEDLIARTLAQRNFDLEQLQNSAVDKQRVDRFLSSQQTSVKNPEAKKGPVYNVSSDEVKFIQIGTELPFGLEGMTTSIESPEKKHITWADESSSNIFSKLKPRVPDEKEDTDMLKTLIDKVDALTSMVQTLTAKFEGKMSKSILEP
jgi:hypothetical protein